MTSPRHMVDINIPRFNQAFVAGLTAIAFVLQAWQVVAAVFLIVAATRLAGPKFGLVHAALRPCPAAETCPTNRNRVVGTA